MPYGYEYPSYTPQCCDPTADMIVLYNTMLQKYDGLIDTIHRVGEAVDGFYNYVHNEDIRISTQFGTKLTNAVNAQNETNIQFNRYIANLQSQINDLATAMQETISEITAEQYAIMEQKLSFFQTGINQKITELNVELARLKIRVTAVEKTINDISQIDTATIKNPVTFKLGTIEKTIKELNGWLSTDGYTVGEMEFISWIHGENIINAGWTVYDMIFRSKQLIGQKGYDKYMRDPLTGEWNRISYVLLKGYNQMFANWQTADEYKDLGYTAAELKNLGLTAIDIIDNGIPERSV